MPPAGSGRRIRGAVVYASRFGTTEKVARAFEAGLEEAGVDASLASIQESPPGTLTDYDLICLGGPTEAFSASKPMKDYLKDARGVDLAGKMGFAFDTRLDSRFSGSASKFIEHALDDQGVHVLAGRESAIVSTTREKGAIVGAKLKEGEEQRFNELGRRLGELAEQAWPKLQPTDGKDKSTPEVT